MRAIDHDLEPVEPQAAREARFHELDVAPAGIVEALGAAQALRRRALPAGALDLRLDRLLDLVRELVAIGAEQLDAVVLVGIVRGRDHDAGIGAQGPRQHGDGGRRQRPDQDHVHAHGDEAGGERGLDQVAREPRILADDDEVAVVAAAQHQPRRHRHLEHGVGGHRLGIGRAANPVRAEVPAHAQRPSPRPLGLDLRPSLEASGKNKPLTLNCGRSPRRFRRKCPSRPIAAGRRALSFSAQAFVITRSFWPKRTIFQHQSSGAKSPFRLFRLLLALRRPYRVPPNRSYAIYHITRTPSRVGRRQGPAGRRP